MTEFEINGKEYDVVNYDLDNRINKVDVDGTDVEYRYDAMGRRVLRKESNTTIALIWWGSSECSEHKHQAGQTVIQNEIIWRQTIYALVMTYLKQIKELQKMESIGM